MNENKRKISALAPYKIENNEVFIYLQKRAKNAKIAPGLFGFFGGGREGDETKEEALLREIEEGFAFKNVGLNTANRNSYMGPCPPNGTHRYFFKIFALDTELELESNTTKEDLIQAMKSHVIEQTELIGLYSR